MSDDTPAMRDLMMALFAGPKSNANDNRYSSSVTQPSMSQHLAAIAEAARIERLQILGIVARYPNTTPEVARALNYIRTTILERNDRCSTRT